MKQQLNIRASDLTIKQLDELGEWWGTSQTETFSVVVDRIHQAEQAKRLQVILEDILSGKQEPVPNATDGGVFYFKNDTVPLVDIGRMPGKTGQHILRKPNGSLVAIGGYYLRQEGEVWTDFLEEQER